MFGYIIDYKDLFKKVQGAMAVYTSELDTARAAQVRRCSSRTASRRDGSDSMRRWRPSISSASLSSRQKANLSTFTISAETRRSPTTLGNARRSGLHFTRRAALVRAYANIADDLA